MRFKAINRRALLAATMLAGLAGAFGPAPAIAADKPLVIARAFDLNSLDPARAWCDTCQIYLTNVYETLVTLDADNTTLKPRLATSWTANADQSQYTFKLDPAAKFSDGSPVEAKDVKWSWERLKNVKGGGSFFMDGVASIDTPDAATVVVNMSSPNSEFINIVTSSYMGVMNSDVVAANGGTAAADADKTDTAEAWLLANSAGSGPYVLTSYKPDDELRLGPNASYSRTKVGIGEVVMKHTKDSVAQAQMLESGAADLAMQVDADSAKRLEGKATVDIVPSFNFLYVAISPGAKGNTTPLTREVREAMALALDYDGIIQMTVGGAGKPIASPIPNGFPGTAGLPMPKQDVAKAKELLAKAGLANGFEIEATFPNMNVYGVDMSLLMQKVQQDLAAVGVKANLSPVEFSVWREKVRGEGIPLTSAFFAPDYFGSAQYVQFFGMIEGNPWWKRAGGANDPSITNKEAADLLKKAMASPPAEADALYNQLGQGMISDRVIVPVVSPDVILAYGKDIDGVRYSACCNLKLDDIVRK
jgi:peptide/nickel transport system substrate-binding protein